MLIHGSISCPKGSGSKGTIYCLVTYESAGGSGVVDEAYASIDEANGVPSNSFLIPVRNGYRFECGLRDAYGNPRVKFIKYDASPSTEDDAQSS